ncbi:hypothetical protein [Stigmatella aurantiaca]|uniref:Conserved uncharacterized protein n=1 Tax=Stigmatella aurantiaca (strain DW4/3-1) TaxID=378806 RepID=Q097Z3_STIAD|nr:hypothetical protein [Stigmatella aurantiaca]ADO71491.1 conserved uncharacterized protein [Stigmatella aurantiaca DW4/3-1]EAU68070.1 putative integral membrane protein [Stigmatella aurantiaca DW4/3-1]
MKPSPGIQELRPLALGEMIDRSATFWRAHLKPLFLLCFGFELVNYILTKAVVLSLERTNALFQADATAQAQDDPMGMLGDVGIMMLSSSALWLVLIWSYWMATLAVTRYVVPLQFGEPARPADGLRRGWSTLASFTGAYLLSQLWALGAFLAMMLPGGALAGVGFLLARDSEGASSIVSIVLISAGLLLSLLGALAALLWYFLRFSLLAPVFAMEDLGAVAAFRRSGRLISGRVQAGFLGHVKVRAMLLLTIMSGILIAISFVSGLPAWIVRLSYANPLDPASVAANPIPQTLLVPVELIQVVGQSLFTPLALVFSAMFYLDMRMRREGLDLERRMGAPRPSP